MQLSGKRSANLKLSLKEAQEISLTEIWFLMLFKRVFSDIIRREASQVVFT